MVGSFQDEKERRRYWIEPCVNLSHSTTPFSLQYAAAATYAGGQVYALPWDTAGMQRYTSRRDKNTQTRSRERYARNTSEVLAQKRGALRTMGLRWQHRLIQTASADNTGV